MTYTPPATLKLPITPGRYACSVPGLEIHVHRVEGDIAHAQFYRKWMSLFDGDVTADWWRADGSCVERGGAYTLTERLGDLPDEAPKPVAQPPPSDDGWIEWHGGEQPVAGHVRVDVKLRNGHENRSTASAFLWSHHSTRFDIIAYRVVGADPKLQPIPASDLRERLLLAAFSGPLAGQLLEACEGDPAAAMRRLSIMTHDAINGYP